jgi:hypothetical protein
MSITMLPCQAMALLRAASPRKVVLCKQCHDHLQQDSDLMIPMCNPTSVLHTGSTDTTPAALLVLFALQLQCKRARGRAHRAASKCRQ